MILIVLAIINLFKMNEKNGEMTRKIIAHQFKFIYEAWDRLFILVTQHNFLLLFQANVSIET